jgi:hypothetical protein
MKTHVNCLTPLFQYFNLNLIKPLDPKNDLEKIQGTEEHVKHYQVCENSKIKIVEKHRVEMIQFPSMNKLQVKAEKGKKNV